ncbi:uncharacterized protein LOC115746399 isoform X2 [Rhodamnia argentea]|uniref:Uncharacterized protein LOC115746399 isoform X2 n=1 Tax=Rhodamnia argentea TaxID=178133 RepID=A0A8B8PTA9_9MYRT|nr:uncharacterized protein LOC115746399 isoform X2 [Rhodamnia argentea]
MASSFDRWEKDPFFSAAEEVQESADRMQSTYRTWIHAKKDSSVVWNLEELQRDLHTALGTAKWQLEEFERAVQSSYGNSSSDDARDRHYDFIVAINDQISKINSSLQQSALLDGKRAPSWVRLDERERNEFASFLSGSSAFEAAGAELDHVMDNEDHRELWKESTPECSKNSCQSTERSSMDASEEKSYGHRRAASASADISAWNIAIAGEAYPQSSSSGHSVLPPRKVPSVSGFLNSMGSVSKLKWSKNGFRKWKADSHQEDDTALLGPAQLERGVRACYERSKSCLDNCDGYEKQLYGWYGALQRQLQRSQYQMQYSRPVQLAFAAILVLCLIVVLAFCVI